MSVRNLVHCTLVLTSIWSSALNAQSVPMLWPSGWKLAIAKDQPPNLALALKAAPHSPTPIDAEAERPTPDWCFLRVAGTQENRDALDVPPANPDPPDAPVEASVPIGRWPLQHPGTALLGIDLAPVLISAQTEALTEWAGSHVAKPKEVPLLAGANTRVLHVRSVKSLVSIARADGETEGASGTSTSKSGQRVEIRPLMDPVTASIGSIVPCRVYALGDALPGSTYTATHLPTGRVQRVETNDKGIGHFTVDAPGEWLVEFHHLHAMKGMEDRFGRVEADVVLHSATLTFLAGGSATPREGGTP